jgi:hypothetical protein
MVLILLGPFGIVLLNPPPPFPHDHDLYILTPIKYNTFSPKIYVLFRAYVIIKMASRMEL